MENNEIDFFISHSKEVKYSIAIPIAQILSKIGFNVWIDRKYICLGKFIYPQIEDAIKLSKYCIAVIDEAYLKRTWTITELEQFHKKNTCTILPIYVNLTKDIVYNKIPWLNGIAFEYLKDNTFNLESNFNILCRIISAYYQEYITNTFEITYKQLIKLDFPCKNTLISILKSKDYYSHDYRLAIISLCNIIDIVYAIYKSKFDIYNKFISIIFQFNDIVKNYCYNIQCELDYNIYIATYNCTIISMKELEYLLKQKQ